MGKQMETITTTCFPGLLGEAQVAATHKWPSPESYRDPRGAETQKLLRLDSWGVVGKFCEGDYHPVHIGNVFFFHHSIMLVLRKSGLGSKVALELGQQIGSEGKGFSIV